MTSLNTEKKQIDLIGESIKAYRTCNECIDLHKRGHLTFLDVEEFVDDRGKSCLYRLKQLCHELFRNDREAHYKEKFYDITVGYVFHEAMKLREIVYQLEYYKPQYNTLIDSQELTPGERKVIREFDMQINKAQKRLSEGLKEVHLLLKELIEHTKELIKLYADNYLLPRFILENEKFFIMIYGKKGYHDLLSDLYEKGRVTLILKAAMSYLESEYYQTAKALLQKVISLDKKDVSAQFLFLYASAFNSYLRNRLSMAAIFGEEGLSLPIGALDLDSRAESLRNLLDDIRKEMGKTGRSREEKGRAYLRI
jgi:hypothetical protein